MSRLIQTQTVGQERAKLTKMVVIAIRELMKQQSPDSTTKDIGAFIATALFAIHNTIERTVQPWEKRDYWVKADRFRREWAWVEPLAIQVKELVIKEDWQELAMVVVQVGSHLKSVQVSPRHRMGKPWVGAWKRLQRSDSGNGFVS